MPSGTKSEWYLPDKDKYREFFDMAFVYINSQIPQPEEAYLFYVDKAKDQLVRQHKDQFMPKITREILLNTEENNWNKRSMSVRGQFCWAKTRRSSAGANNISKTN